MSLTEMTLDDRMRLERLRNERLRSFFAQELLNCIFRFNRHKVLEIHCPQASTIEALLPNVEELCDYAWLILGVEAVTLYFSWEPIICVEHSNVHSVSRTNFH
jgi:hypothetical protein